MLGWDISSLDLGSAMERAQVLDWSLQEQLQPHMSCLKPRPSIYIPEFIAANQESRADNVLTGTMAEQVIKVSHSPFYSSVYFFFLLQFVSKST